MINLKASRRTGTINVGVNPITNINVNNPGQASAVLNYPDPNFPSVSPNVAEQTVLPGTLGPSADTIRPTDPTAIGDRSANGVCPTIQYKTQDELDKEALLREINVLKLIIDIQHSNPMVVNRYIVADDDALGKMVGLLCNASEVHLDADDVGVGCISKKTYRKVNSIYVVVNGETLNLKYDFPAVMKTLKDLHISTKYVW